MHVSRLVWGLVALSMVACRVPEKAPSTPEEKEAESAENKPDDELRKRAAFDMNCQSLEFTKISDKTMGVRGCGKQLVYVESCQNPHVPWDCNWVLNSDERRAPSGD